MADSTQDTLAHRQMVVDFATDFCTSLLERADSYGDKTISDAALDFCNDIMDRAYRHDESQLHKPEKERFDYVGTHQHLSKHTYGSDEYKKSLEYLGPALDHHYQENDHHPQHFPNGISGMNLMQLVEMWLDWLAACKRNKNGNIYQSLEVNKDRFKISDQLYNVLLNQADVVESDKRGDGSTNLFGLVEMWLDCVAANSRDESKSIHSIVESDIDRTLLSEQLYNIICNTANTFEPQG
jgi:hypothetical protein